MVEIFTDGAALGNPGPGGYGVILRYGKQEKEMSAGFRKTTNNRMELLAVITGLKELKREGLNIVVYSDSRYVIDAINKGWVFSWQRKNFKDKKNPDLWQLFLMEYKKHLLEFKWVKGHSGHSENERCDELAVWAAKHPTQIDMVYEEQKR